MSAVHLTKADFLTRVAKYPQRAFPSVCADERYSADGTGSLA